MKTSKHFALVALLVLGTAAPAIAAKAYPLPLYPVGDEPNASGTVLVRSVNSLVKVSCNNLTPGETYFACTDLYCFGSFVANGGGNGSTDWASSGPFDYTSFLIIRADGTLVLSSFAP